MDKQFLGKLASVLKANQNVVLTGLTGSAKSCLFHAVGQAFNSRILCLVPNEETAYDLARDLRALSSRDRVHLFLNRDLLFIKENYSQTEADRIRILYNCLSQPERKDIIIATPGAFMYPLISPDELQKKTVHLTAGQEIDVQHLLHILVANSYTRADMVTRPGEFAWRGGIVDIYPLSDQQPVRIDFFGDMIESIRNFDSNTQRTAGFIKSVTVCPADELQGDDPSSTLLDYFSGEIFIFFDEPREFFSLWNKKKKRFTEVREEMKKMEKPVPPVALVDMEILRQQIGTRGVLYHTFFSGNVPQVSCKLLENVAQKEMEQFHHQYDRMFDRIEEWLSRGYQVQMAIKNKTARRQLEKDLLDRHIVGVTFIEDELEKGFVSQTFRCALITEGDIWGKRSTRSIKKNKKRPSEARILVEDLKIGDYVVHDQHGVGIFRGISQVETDGITREYITIQYAGSDKLYLPVDRLDSLYRFTVIEDKEPRLNRLGGSEWERTKKKVTDSIQEMAQELLLRYARRQAQEGFRFSLDTPWQAQFEDDFPYTETPDQLKAIMEVKKDMEHPRPMDRLICGDVGYGKTEVAMRAAFKALMDGKQVAILVPTTVLAEQHFQTFKERFSLYPSVIDCLSRFKTTAQQKKVAAGLAKGAIDIVIGTHRLLSKDILFKDLGLLIIDEEHRFGVAQKERIRAYRELVDVLSLSATPIPRSLHMSLSGLRDMSIIDTPPPGRYPITTYVMEFNIEIICEAILHEIERQGQVFFVHNRIEDIEKVKAELNERLPHVMVGIGHGRMMEDELAKVMMDFSEGKFQVFLCTTIIESGLDLPNVNTIVIDEADKMGLAQLYQLRGRVGRSDRLAYAYLTYRPYRAIKETAQKRLWAIREFSDLGSGIKIALRDLEIRGFGNILGAEQHGYMQAVGFDLYCHLLEQETARLKGETPRKAVNPLLDIDMDYYIPDTYISDSGIKMHFYHRLLLAANTEEINDIKEELVDRFGKLPLPVENFLHIAALRVLAKEKEIVSLRRNGKFIVIKLSKPWPDERILKAEFPGVKKIKPDILQLPKSRYSLHDLQNLLRVI